MSIWALVLIVAAAWVVTSALVTPVIGRFLAGRVPTNDGEPSDVHSIDESGRDGRKAN